MSTSTTDRRKVLAVLAAGLVLGVGAAGVLAAWNDSEFATGTFTAGSFNLEGATDGAGGTYDDHNVDDGDTAAALTFSLPLSGNMAPDDVVYAPFWVRLDSATTIGGTLAADAVNGAGANAANLEYDVYALAPTDACDATAPAAPGATLLASGDDLTDFTAGATVPLAAGAGVAGAPVQLCFVVTAGADLAQGGSATATWSFTATSD